MGEDGVMTGGWGGRTGQDLYRDGGTVSSTETRKVFLFRLPSPTPSLGPHTSL